MRTFSALLASAILLLGPIRSFLLRFDRRSFAPRSTIALWQVLGLTAFACALGASLIGLSVPFGDPAGFGLLRAVSWIATGGASALTPGELFALTAGLIVATLLVAGIASRTFEVLRARARCRNLIDLVATPASQVPGTFVVDHKHPTAYCLPGFRSRIVLSSGALDALHPDELAAVLAHERAHVRARHHLVVFPFIVLASLAPGSRALSRLRDEVKALVEMAADDRALSTADPTALARALCQLTVTDTPEMALGATGSLSRQRIERLLAPRTARSRTAFGTVAACAAVLALPLVALELIALTWG